MVWQRFVVLFFFNMCCQSAFATLPVRRYHVSCYSAETKQFISTYEILLTRLVGVLCWYGRTHCFFSYFSNRLVTSKNCTTSSCCYVEMTSCDVLYLAIEEQSVSMAPCGNLREHEKLLAAGRTFQQHYKGLFVQCVLSCCHRVVSAPAASLSGQGEKIGTHKVD